MCVVRMGWNMNCHWSFFIYVLFVLQRHSTDISGAPWGDIHHSEFGPLSTNANPQQVSIPTAAKGNRQR